MSDGVVRAAWVETAVALGGDPAVAADRADELVRRYREPPRHYHDTGHVAAVLDDAAGLCAALDVDGSERASIRAAACAHDVVYRGRAGDDERASADWARAALAAAGVTAPVADRVHDLVLATADHRAPPGDVAAAVLLDADLAVLARDPAGYATYVAAVRREYAHVDDEQWRTGRGAVLRELLARGALYVTAPARTRWEAAARANMTTELDALTGGRGDG